MYDVSSPVSMFSIFSMKELEYCQKSVHMFSLAETAVLLPSTVALICDKINFKNYSKASVKRPLKNRHKNILMTNGSSMTVESIEECSPWSILQ